MSMLLALTASIALSSEAAPAPRPRRQFDIADDLATHDPQRFRYRGTSFGFGARLYADFAAPAGHGSVFLAGTSEFGTRRARLAVELNMAPIPYLESDFLVGLPWIGLAVGGLFGNERIRGGVFAIGGYYWWGAEGRLVIAPWRTARGGRHGVDLTLGWGNLTFMVLGFGYRWFPALLNHRRR